MDRPRSCGVIYYFDTHALRIRYQLFDRVKKQFNDVEVFAGDFTNRLTKGFKLGSPYSDVTNSLSNLPMESPTK